MPWLAPLDRSAALVVEADPKEPHLRRRPTVSNGVER